AFNHDTVQWYIYGYGRVSDDGKVIAPETDPNTGRPYGLRDFSWHLANVAPGGNPSDPDCGNRTNNTVDLSTGLKIETMTDIAFGGVRGGINLSRMHTGDLAGSCDNCPFGRGWTHNFDITARIDRPELRQLLAAWLKLPGQITGRLFRYAGPAL